MNAILLVSNLAGYPLHRQIPLLQLGFMTNSPVTGQRYAVGDRVRWNSQGADVLGMVTEIHTADFEFMGRVRICSEDEPQYKVRSDSSQRHAVHKGAALRPAKD